mmetsp:Transcript_5060/g.12816  ORF Transcript_5060/g.12816 Transcript_5060/m.12816 type:complete len:116 (-) Transcript_5060:2846-3193(-)
MICVIDHDDIDLVIHHLKIETVLFDISISQYHDNNTDITVVEPHHIVGTICSNDGDDTVTTMTPTIITEPTILPADPYESAGNIRSPQSNTAITVLSGSEYNAGGDRPDVHFPIN